MTRTPTPLLYLPLVALLACDQGPTEPTCDLTVDNVAGKTFVMAEAQPKGPPVLNPLARLHFEDEGGKTVAKYTAMSLGDIYSYQCEKVEKEGKDPELKCMEPPRLQDWCEALYARDIKCTRKRLRKLGAEATDEELEKVIEDTKAAMDKVKDDEMAFKRWKAIRASLGNKLQGQLFAKVDSRCRLKIDDMYWTLKPDGTKVEDTNPVGTNPFQKSDEDYLFLHCDNQAELYDADAQGFPKLPITEPPQNALDKPIWYYHIGEAGSKAEDGCQYSYDTFASWKPLAQNQAPTAGEDGRLVWSANHTFTEANAVKAFGKTVGIFHMARYKTCGGKKETIDVSCRTTVFQ
jgi:hypothetical protein